MRIIYTFLVVLIFVSCSKDDAVVSSTAPTSSVSATQVINATVKGDFTYELPLSSSDIQIHQQAAHYSLSKIGVDAKTGNAVYQYVRAKGFEGTDEVMLKDVQTYNSHSTEGGGCMNSNSPRTANKTSFIKIRFTVSN